MRFLWLLDCKQQGQFKIYMRSGKTNLAKYFTKHHLAAQHRNMRGEFLMGVGELKQGRMALSISEVSCKGVLQPLVN